MNSKSPKKKAKYQVNISPDISHAYLAAIIVSSEDAIVSKDLNSIITSWNKSAEKIFGFTAEEVIGKPITIIIPPELLNEEKMIISNLKQGKQIEHFETVRITKDGKRLYVSLSISPIKDARGNVIGAANITRDITERKSQERRLLFLYKASKILHESLNYKDTLESLSRLIVPDFADWFSVDVVNDKGGIDLIALRHIDPKKVKWGYELREKFPPDMTAKTGAPEVIRTGKPEFYPLITQEMINAVIKDKELLEIVNQIGFSSSITVPLVSVQKVIGVLSLVYSESRRHYTQDDLFVAEELGWRAGIAIDHAKVYQELEESKERLDVILQNAADGITVQDINGRVTYANKAASQLAGYKSTEEFLKASFEDFLSRFELRDKDGNPLTANELPGRQTLNGKGVHDAIIRYINKETGEEKWTYVKTRAVYGSDKKINLVINIFHDITQNRMLEKRKDEFISIASHELKTPVTSIKVFINILQKIMKQEGNTKILEYLERMNRQTDKLTGLVKDLLDLSRIQTGKFEYKEELFSLDELIKEIVDYIQPTTSKHKIIISNVEKKKIKGDRDRIGQVVINLLTNAIKYSPKGGRITVSTKTKDSHITVRVKDQGIGIDKNQQKKIFERFYQANSTDSGYPGLGIGLYISSEILKRHNGKIWVRSTTGKGSSFYFSLPIIDKVKN